MGLIWQTKKPDSSGAVLSLYNVMGIFTSMYNDERTDVYSFEQRNQMFNCEWLLVKGSWNYMTSPFLIAQRHRDYCWVSAESQMVWSGVSHMGRWVQDSLTCKQERGVLTDGWSAQGPRQGSGNETSKSLRRSIDIGGDLLSLSPLPWEAWEAWEACGINVSVSHVFIALCSDVVGRCALSPSADVKNKLTRRQLFDFVLAVTEFPTQ